MSISSTLAKHNQALQQEALAEYFALAERLSHDTDAVTPAEIKATLEAAGKQAKDLDAAIAKFHKAREKAKRDRERAHANELQRVRRVAAEAPQVEGEITQLKAGIAEQAAALQARLVEIERLAEAARQEHEAAIAPSTKRIAHLQERLAGEIEQAKRAVYRADWPAQKAELEREWMAEQREFEQLPGEIDYLDTLFRCSTDTPEREGLVERINAAKKRLEIVEWNRRAFRLQIQAGDEKIRAWELERYEPWQLSGRKER